MKPLCEEVGGWLLLEQADELPAIHQAELDAHLEACADCRALARELVMLRQVTRRALSVQGPLPRTVEAVKAEAQRRVQDGPMLFPAFWRIPVAAAALLGLVAGTSLLLMSVRPSASSELSQAGRMLALVAVLQDEYSNAETAPALDGGSGLPHGEEELKILAHELLRYQGLASDDLFYEEQSELPDATDPQWHSSRVPPARICG